MAAASHRSESWEYHSQRSRPATSSSSNPFEEVLFRYEKGTRKYFCERYGHPDEHEVPHDFTFLAEAMTSGFLTTAARYSSEGVPTAEPTDGFARMALRHQRIRPWWMSVAYLGNYTRSGTLEVGTDGTLLIIKAADAIKELLDQVVSDINSQSCIAVTYGEEAAITIDKNSEDYAFALRLELKKRDLHVYGESSYYHGRSSL